MTIDCCSLEDSELVIVGWLSEIYEFCISAEVIMLRSKIIILSRKTRDCAPGRALAPSILNTRNTKLSNQIRLYWGY